MATYSSSESSDNEQVRRGGGGGSIGGRGGGVLVKNLAGGSEVPDEVHDLLGPVDVAEPSSKKRKMESNEPPERESDSTLEAAGYKDDAVSLQAKITAVEKKLKKSLLQLKTFGISITASDSTTKEVLLELCDKRVEHYLTAIQKHADRINSADDTDMNLTDKLQLISEFGKLKRKDEDDLKLLISEIKKVTHLYERMENYIIISKAIPPPCPSIISKYHNFFKAISCKFHCFNTLQFHAARQNENDGTVEYLAPVTLVCDAFAKYQHLFASKDAKDIPSKYWKVALSMIHTLNCHNDDEDAVRDKLETCLQHNDIFSGFAVQSISTQRYKTDISLYSSRGKIDEHCMANLELKLSLCGTGSCPELENIAYFYNMKTHFMFCIVICGWSYFQVFGVARLKDCNNVIKTIVMPLGASFSLRLFGDGEDDILLAKSLYALDSSSKEWENIVSRHGSEPRLLDVLPQLEGINYKKRLFSNKLLFTAETDHGEKVIKFVLNGNYGIDVHQHLSNSGFAPAGDLCPCNDLWSAVVMDSVDGEVLSKFMSSEVGDEIKTSISNQLDTILKLLKDKNFVHGDLRSENIMITKSNQVQVIDFDWAGQQGHVYYPRFADPEIYPQGDGIGNSLIFHQNDVDRIETIKVCVHSTYSD